jgi:hypothetical protein
MIRQLSQPARPSRLEEELTHSLANMAQDLERALRRQHDIERHLNEALQEKDQLKASCAAANAELASVRLHLKSEIFELQRHLTESSKTASSRNQAEFAAKEKLIRDEYERKLQAFQVSLKQERRQLQARIDRMKEDLSGCICRQTMELANRR